MEFDRLINGYKAKACVMSVEKFPDGSYGNIRIAAGNRAHCEDMMNVMHRPFIPNSPYEEYLPQNKNFEDFCYRSAFLGQPLHSYVSLPQMGLWLNMFLLPLESDEENIGYCIYSYEVTPNADLEQRSSLSADTASAVLKTCIKLRGSNNIHNTFNEVMEDIRKICGSLHCCILLVNKDTRSCNVFCEALAPDSGLPPMSNLISDDFFDITQTWDSTLGDSTCIIIKDQRDMEWLSSINPLWADSLIHENVKSLVFFPLRYNGDTLGYMWVGNFNVDNTVKIKEALELTTFFLASEIANYQLMQKLEILSSIDMLTGVKNRNTMNNTVDEIVSGKRKMHYPYSVIFADLNGLKRVNDEEGHIAGDQLLISAASILRGVFHDGEVYRAGGDEFMLIADGLGAEALEARVKQLCDQAATTKYVHFAVGTCIVNEGEDIRNAMHLADERMYADKNEYYENHPERKYR
ncbi:sensor domain-containing diguanylate cyclase [Ruminococcus sp.]|uniref:GGDEF domain-containing protein n=1 Tax=Ruminococcus sp. TaxID=41978 RepID=UPI0025FEF39E|nr:sensor domain-containing diguanylate cyclase [Ruminococcus sp.]